MPKNEWHDFNFSAYKAFIQHLDIAIKDPAAPLTPKGNKNKKNKRMTYYLWIFSST